MFISETEQDFDESFYPWVSAQSIGDYTQKPFSRHLWLPSEFLYKKQKNKNKKKTKEKKAKKQNKTKTDSSTKPAFRQNLLCKNNLFFSCEAIL